MNLGSWRGEATGGQASEAQTPTSFDTHTDTGTDTSGQRGRGGQGSDRHWRRESKSVLRCGYVHSEGREVGREEKDKL